jgi:putative nucleotidyltransferase with HDIG domain
MRIINLNELNNDMILARPIYYKNCILLNKDQKNLLRYKNRLIRLGINYIYIDDELSKDIIINDIIKEQTRQKGINIIRKTFDDIQINKNIEIQNLKDVVNDIIDELLNSKKIIFNMVKLDSYDSYTFSHSVNVAILSIFMGKLLDLNKNYLYKLGLGALLHDIGKVFIPEIILNKKGKLTKEEYEIIKKHPSLGYNYLKDNSNIDAVTRAIALHHHERLDGSGYPDGQKRDEIHKLVKIVAVADVFDALTSNRIYRKKWPIYEAIEYLMANSEHKFCSNYVGIFTKFIAVYPNGSKVVLSDGRYGIVREQNDNYPTRPIVDIIKDNKRVETINLLDYINIIIREVL